jgi:hypothetical protein
MHHPMLWLSGRQREPAEVDVSSGSGHLRAEGMYKHDLGQMTGWLIQDKVLKAILVQYYTNNMMVAAHKMILAQERMSGIRLKN